MGLLPEFNTRVRALMAAAKEAGYDPRITSGYRSEADQARAIESVSRNVNGRPASFVEYSRGIPGYAAGIGKSNHQRGEAVDFGTGPALGWMRQNAGAYGVQFPARLAKSDPIHAEVDPNFMGPVQDPNDRGAPVQVPASAQPDPAKTANYQPKRGGMSAAQPMMMLGGPKDAPTGNQPMALYDPQQQQQGFSLDNWMTSPLFQMGAGVLGAPNIGQGLMQGSQAASQFATARQRQQRDAEMFPLQKQLLQSQVESANDPLKRQLLQAQVNKANEPATSDDIREFQFAKKDGFAGGFADWMKQKREMNGQTAQQVTWGTDAQGNYVAMQASRDGKLVQSQLPQGVVPVPAEVLAYRKTQANQQGEASGKARANLPVVETQAKLMKDALDAVESDPYLPTMTGFAANYRPNISKEAVASQARIDQVQGKAFLQAFEGLRGAGAITVEEGAKATASISRLQAMAVGTDEYKRALNDVRKEIDALVSLARQKASAPEPGVAVRPGQAPGQPAQQGPIDLGNGIKIRRLD